MANVDRTLNDTPGKKAYTAYMRHRDLKSDWNALPRPVKGAWEAAAKAARQ